MSEATNTSSTRGAITYRQAMHEAIMEEMTRDSSVVYMGVNIGLGRGAYNVALTEKFGDRIINTPICETMIAESGLGMAIGGLRPICELQFGEYVSLAHDAMANYASKIPFWTRGKVHLPMVLYTHQGAFGMGNQHGQIVESWLSNVPGLKIIIPSTPSDAKGLMKTAIRDNDPVIFITPSNKLLFGIKGEVSEDPEEVIPFGKARIAREGTDITVVCWQRTYLQTMALVDELAAEGISVEVIDPRSLIPFDKNTVIESVKKTGHLVVAHEAPYRFGAGAEFVATVAQEAFPYLKAAPVKVGSPLHSFATMGAMEHSLIQKDDIKQAILNCLGK